MYSDCWHRSSCASYAPDLVEMPLTAAVRSPTAPLISVATQLPMKNSIQPFTFLDATQRCVAIYSF